MKSAIENNFVVEKSKKFDDKTRYLIANLKTGIVKENKVEQTSFLAGVIADILKKEGFNTENCVGFLHQNKKDWAEDIKSIDKFKIRWSDLMFVKTVKDTRFLIVVSPLTKYEKIK